MNNDYNNGNMEFVYIDKTNNISDEDIILDVLHVKNDILNQETLTSREYLLHGKFGRKAIWNHFGSWNNLLSRLNIELTNTYKISDEDIILDVLHVKNDILKKNSIIMREYFLHGKFGRKAIRNHFGSWNNLLKKLNIKPTKINSHLSKEDIFQIIEKLWINLERQPTLRDFENLSGHTKKIIVKNFGKWSICLQQFVAWSKGQKEIVEMKIKTKHKTPRDPSKSLRYDVLKRDGFRCVKCGKSPVTDPGITLHIDHIVPYSLGGETTLDNLQTLCSECNLGKSNKHD